MNTQDYIAVVALAFNIFVSLKSLGFTKKNVEKALYNNRQLLGKTLSDIVEHATKTTSLPDAVSVVEQDAVNIVEGVAHSQAGAK